VTLLGDAAHPVLPHTGQGAAQAITDAVALGRHLHVGCDVPAALRAYESERRPPTAALLGQGRRTAALMRSRSRVVDELRAAAIRVAPIAPFVRLFARLNRRAGTDVR
jgi:2-polyprenyl-6-methoxyphenol hydroxylase-like FAD-dependent oxidoreductase